VVGVAVGVKHHRPHFQSSLQGLSDQEPTTAVTVSVHQHLSRHTRSSRFPAAMARVWQRQPEPVRARQRGQRPSRSVRVRQSLPESVRSPSEVRQSPPALAGTQQDRQVAVSVGKWQSGRSSDSQCKQNPSSPVVRAWQLSLEFIRVCQSLLGPIKARERMASASQRLSGPIRAHQSSPRLVRAYQDSPRLGRASPRPVGARQR
jgi:hypothetical protein